jgi:hypothetical protein
MICHFFEFDPRIIFSLNLFLGYLVGKIAEVLIVRHRDDRQEFRLAYAKFAESFTDYLQALENTDVTLNALIIGEFQKHDLAMRNFLRFLDGSRKKKFLRKWAEYEKKYYEIKQLGPMGAAVAIAPPDVDITKVGHNPQEMIRWEINRRREIHKIIHDLLHIANKKYIF